MFEVDTQLPQLSPYTGSQLACAAHSCGWLEAAALSFASPVWLLEDGLWLFSESTVARLRPGAGPKLTARRAPTFRWDALLSCDITDTWCLRECACGMKRGNPRTATWGGGTPSAAAGCSKFIPTITSTSRAAAANQIRSYRSRRRQGNEVRERLTCETVKEVPYSRPLKPKITQSSPSIPKVPPHPLVVNTTFYFHRCILIILLLAYFL